MISDDGATLVGSNLVDFVLVGVGAERGPHLQASGGCDGDGGHVFAEGGERLGGRQRHFALG